MFMRKEEAFSDDELDDVDNDVVVPLSVEGPTPVVMSGPYATSPDARSNAYNERLSRARNALTQQRHNKFTNNGFSCPHHVLHIGPQMCVYRVFVCLRLHT